MSGVFLCLALLFCVSIFTPSAASAPVNVCFGQLWDVTSGNALRANRCIATVEYVIDKVSRDPAYANISWGLHNDLNLIDTHGFPYRAAQLALKHSLTPCDNGAEMSVLFGPALDASTMAAATVLGPLGVTTISPMSRSPAASNNRLYPRAFRTSDQFDSEIKTLYTLIKQQGWHKIAVVYSQNDAGVMIANEFGTRALADGYSIDILEQALSENDVGDGAYRAMKNFRDLRYRIIIIHAGETMAKLLLSTMNKLYMLNGDFIVLGTSYWTSSPTGDAWTSFNNDEKKWLNGAIGVALVPPSGDAWLQSAAALTKFRPEFFYPTHDSAPGLAVKNTFDAVTAAITAVGYLVDLKKEVNKDSIYEMIRDMDGFPGLDGTVYMDAQGDSLPRLSLLNFVDGAFTAVGIYQQQDLEHEPELTIHTPIHWPDGMVGGQQSDAVPRHLLPVPAWAIHLGYGFLAVAVIENLLLHYYIHKERAHEVIKASSPIFCHLIVAGTAFTYLIPALGSISQDTLCRALPGCVGAAFSIVFGSVFAKTWRIHRIFNSRTLTRKAPTTKNLFTVVAVMLAFEALVQIIWMSSDLPEAEIIPHPTNQFGSVEVCTAKHMDVWWSLSLIPKVVAIMFGLYFAYKVRKLNHNFNEAKYISMAVYNVMFLSALLMAVALLFETDPTWSYLIRVLAPMAISTLTQLILFLPKFWDIYVTHDWVEYVSDAIYENGVLVHKSSKGSRHSHGNSAGSFDKTGAAAVGQERKDSRPLATANPSVTKPLPRAGNYLLRQETSRPGSSNSIKRNASVELSMRTNAASPVGTWTPGATSPTPDSHMAPLHVPEERLPPVATATAASGSGTEGVASVVVNVQSTERSVQ